MIVRKVLGSSLLARRHCRLRRYRRRRARLAKASQLDGAYPMHYYILGSGSHHSYDYRTNYYPTWNYE